MKPDIIRQPLLLAIASILVVIAAAMTTGTTISPAPETMISTPLGDLIGLFQERFPRCSRILCGGLLLLTGILCGRLAVRYGLYPVSSTLTIPLYGLVACGILLGQEYLTESVAAFVLLMAGISDTLTVLARGSVLAEGPYAEVAGNPLVIEAYMGTEVDTLASPAGH